MYGLMELQAWWYRSLPDSLQVMGSLSNLIRERELRHSAESEELQ